MQSGFVLGLAWPVAATVTLFGASAGVVWGQEVRDEAWFLHRLRSVDHLPELEISHTALASTWDRTGGNADGTDFKRIEGTTNILLDVEGPGCIHRLFTGGSEPAQQDTPGYLRVDGTRLQIYLDDSTAPLFDYPVTEFFDSRKGPIPSPLAGDKDQGWTYPGCFLPIPYSARCRVQLVNASATNWGSYWQIAYTTYPTNTKVRSLSWPLAPGVRDELRKVCQTWSRAQANPPDTPSTWSLTRTASLQHGDSLEVSLAGIGVIRDLRLLVDPATPEALSGLRLAMSWDGASSPSLDVPIGYFFGHADSGHATAARFNSLLLGVTDSEAYARFPMPYSNGAALKLRNYSKVAIKHLRLHLQIDKPRTLPANWGRFHARYLEAPAAQEDAPRLGPKKVPGHLVLENQARGKYVGVILRTDWPHDGWWGEGDWMIWTDETDWPPSYHGTGSEEYFNSGWCKFDRKAVSGYVAVHPGHPTEYSFHLNDVFQFQTNIRVAVETMGWDKADEQIRSEHPVWGSTAFWYEPPGPEQSPKQKITSSEPRPGKDTDL